MGKYFLFSRIKSPFTLKIQSRDRFEEERGTIKVDTFDFATALKRLRQRRNTWVCGEITIRECSHGCHELYREQVASFRTSAEA